MKNDTKQKLWELERLALLGFKRWTRLSGRQDLKFPSLSDCSDYWKCIIRDSFFLVDYIKPYGATKPYSSLSLQFTSSRPMRHWTSPDLLNRPIRYHWHSNLSRSPAAGMTSSISVGFLPTFLFTRGIDCQQSTDCFPRRSWDIDWTPLLQ